MTIRNDSAVAPVIAILLILAVLVTFVALYHTTYIPILKEKSEVSHINEVRDAFEQISSDMETIVSDKKPASYSCRFRLGGGDILLSQAKSSGLVNVINVDNIFSLIAVNDTSRSEYLSNMTKIIYSPENTFWEKQGYVWEYGYINVTKGSIQTPLDFYTMNDAIMFFENKSSFSGSLIEFESEGSYNSTLNQNICKTIDVYYVSFVPGEKPYISGNDFAKINLNCNVDKSSAYVNSFEVLFNNEISMKQFNTRMKDYTGAIFTELSNKYANLEYTPFVIGNSQGYRLSDRDGKCTLNLIYHEIRVEISVR